MAEEEGTPQPPRAESLCLVSVTQPFPRSPKALRKPAADPAKFSQVRLHFIVRCCVVVKKKKKTDYC